MATISVGNGVEVDTGGRIQVRRATPDLGLRAAEVPERAALAEALTEAGFEVAAEFELRDKPDVGFTTGAASVSVRVGPGESAVLLVENAGELFAWGYPETSGPGPGLGLAGDGARVLTFSLAGAAPALGVAGPLRRRGPIMGWVMDKLIGRVLVHVLRFVAEKTIDLAVRKIEGDNVSGLVSLAEGVKTWIPGRPIEKPEAGKPILLLAHGTFSSTVGTYGQLAKHDAGRAFLDKARAQYGAVLSWDHKTLAETPEQNAEAFLEGLERLGLPQGATVDAIAFSRGALVYRVLAEQLLAQRRPDIKLRRAVFVGCTNGGTNLAEPDNWEALADVYTNAILGGARLLALLTGGGALAPLAVLGIKTLGRFVQTIAEVGITERRVPGLAAMEPDGTTVTALNGASGDVGRLAEYMAVTSNFEPRFQPRNGLSEIAQAALDKLTDDLIGPENDLVVHTPSMTAFGTRQSRLKDTLAIGTGEDVYHTVYFAQEAVAKRLSGWL